MRASLWLGGAVLAAWTTLSLTAMAQPAGTPPDPIPPPPEVSGDSAAEPAPLPPPDTGSPASHGASSQPPATEPPKSEPTKAVPWYPAETGPQDELTAPEAEAPSEPSRDMSRDFWQVSFGMRGAWVTDAGYDPFDENNYNTRVSVGGTRALLFAGDISFAPGVLYETGSSMSTARGAESELIVHRLGAVAEGRFHLGRDLYLLVNLVPQAIHTRAYLTDASAPTQLRQRTWRFGADATAGAAWNAPRTLGARNQIPQFWVIGELGYGWTMSKDLELRPDLPSDDPQADEMLNLGPMALNGVIMRLRVAMTF